MDNTKLKWIIGLLLFFFVWWNIPPDMRQDIVSGIFGAIWGAVQGAGTGASQVAGPVVAEYRLNPLAEAPEDVLTPGRIILIAGLSLILWLVGGTMTQSQPVRSNGGGGGGGGGGGQPKPRGDDGPRIPPNAAGGGRSGGGRKSTMPILSAIAVVTGIGYAISMPQVRQVLSTELAPFLNLLPF